MKLNRKELRKIQYDFNSCSNRLLQADYEDYAGVLAKFVKYMDSTPIINDYICGCGSCDWNLEEEIKKVQGSYGRLIFSLGETDEEEVRNVYAVLLFLVETNNSVYRGVAMGYSSSSKWQDKIKGFNERFVMVLIRHVERYLTKIGIDMGIDEKNIYNVDFTENTDEKYGFYPIDVVITVKNSNIVGDDLGGEITNPEVPILPGENDGEDNTESEKPPVIDDNTSTGTGDETEGEEDLPLCSDTITDNCKPKEDTPNPDEGGEKEPDACVGEDCKTDADTGDTETGSGENTEDGGDVPVEDAGSETTPDSQDGGDTQLDQGEVSDAQPVLEEVPSSDKLI